MPADYMAVRNSCIKKKEKDSGKTATKKQMDSCKKMAAIWYFKKHGKALPTEKASVMEFTFEENEEINNSVVQMLNDGVIKIEKEQGISKAEISVALSTDEEAIYFTQPFGKKSVNYRPAPLDINGYPTGPCYGCAHIEYLPYKAAEDCLCHLVQGFIDSNYTCDKFTSSLILTAQDVTDNEDTTNNNDPMSGPGD
jgi:hypothetical protein